MDTKDILYYSNYCKHSQNLLQFLVKNNLSDQMSFICIDRRKHDPKTGQVSIMLENGSQIILPPNVHSVPSLLLVKQSYSVIMGNEIISKFSSLVQNSNMDATGGNGEPIGVPLNSVIGTGTVQSEQYTFFNASVNDLSTKGKGGSARPLYNYVSANDDGYRIATPPDTYRPDKVSQNVTVDTLQQMRSEELTKLGANNRPAFIPPSII